MKITNTQEALDPKKGMTFGELRKFVQEGLRYDLQDSAPIKVGVGWRQQIQSLEVKSETGDPDEPPL